MNIQLLLTGNELMNGDVVDSNSAMIADELKSLGLEIYRKVTVGDHMSLLEEELETLSKSADVLLVNGGLGPTRDDLTAETLARVCDVPLQEHPEARAHLQEWADNKGLKLNAANLKQAMLPAGARVVPNSRGTAVGFAMRHNNCEIICTPGVPHELRSMLKQAIIPQLSGHVDPNRKLLLNRYHTFGQGESNLQQWIADKLPTWPDEVELGFRAGAPTLEVKIQTPVGQADIHQQACRTLTDLIGDYIVAEEDSSLAATLIDELKRREQTITFAESCTGGLIASMLTAEPGSSAVFEAGFVTYADHIKSQLVDVCETTLAEHGAVSEPVVREMALGALAASGADYVAAVSGIAGPGGSEFKPEGRVCFGLARTGQRVITETVEFGAIGRGKVRAATRDHALDLLWQALSRIEQEAGSVQD